MRQYPACDRFLLRWSSTIKEQRFCRRHFSHRYQCLRARCSANSKRVNAGLCRAFIASRLRESGQDSPVNPLIHSDIVATAADVVPYHATSSNDLSLSSNCASVSCNSCLATAATNNRVKSVIPHVLWLISLNRCTFDKTFARAFFSFLLKRYCHRPIRRIYDGGE